MAAQKDIRWIHRFANYNKALSQLSKFIDKGDLSEMERQGFVKSFEYTFELAWNVIKDYFEYQGANDLIGSRDAFRLAFKRGLITDGQVWMNMIDSRSKTSHTYNEETAIEISNDVRHKYYPLFLSLRDKMETLKANENKA